MSKISYMLSHKRAIVIALILFVFFAGWLIKTQFDRAENSELPPEANSKTDTNFKNQNNQTNKPSTSSTKKTGKKISTSTTTKKSSSSSGSSSDSSSGSGSSGGSTSTTNTPAPISGKGYGLVFNDNFNSLNRAIWDDHIWYDDPPDPAWNNFQYTSGGILHLVTSRNFFWGGGPNDNYPINTITTQSSGKTWTKGYFEARLKWTSGRGAWPGFWLLSYRHATNPDWPSINSYCAGHGLANALCQSAELDMFEGQGSEPNVFYGTIHKNSCNCYGTSDVQNGNNYQPVGSNLTSGFHTYGMLWTSSQISWYLDNNLLMSAPTYNSTNQPMFMLLQMWVGGWTFDPDNSTPTNIETQVDWVHIWQQ